MRCIDVQVNGALLWRAGVENASMIGPMVHGAMAGDSPAGIRLAGMCDLPDDRNAHVSWCEEHPLAAGDVVSFAFVEADSATPPAEVVATDSAEYLEEQRKFAEFEKSFVPDRTPMRRQFPALTFHCTVNGNEPIAARFRNNEEHILCGIDWNKWRPDVCRIYVRSFGGAEPPSERAPTEWLRANLNLGEQFAIRVAV
jgi:hypothetical protein